MLLWLAVPFGILIGFVVIALILIVFWLMQHRR